MKNTQTNNTAVQQANVKAIVAIALMAALVSAISMIPAIPTEPVPITFQLIGIFLAPLLLGLKGAASVGIYILIGVAGLPVFAKYSSGLSTLLGPTGGYIIGFFFAALLIGLVRSRTKRFLILLPVTVLSLVPVYAAGVLQLSIVLDKTPIEAFFIGVPSFILLDIVKAIVAALLAETIMRRISID